MKMFKRFALLSFFTLSFLSSYSINIETQAGSIRNCVKADINSHEMVYISEEDGTVSLSTLEGKTLWRNIADNPALMFEIIACDIDGDDNDDLLGVSGNGSVYAWKSDGKLLWKFSTPEITRLSEIAVVGEGDKLRVFAGGADFKIYEIDVYGNLVKTFPINGAVRIIESGNFTHSGKTSLFVLTYRSDKFGSLYMGFIDPETGESIKYGKITKYLTEGGSMITDKEVADINNDGRDDIIIFAAGKSCSIVAIDGDLKKLFFFKGSKDAQRYAHCKGTVLYPVKNEIVAQFGGIMYLLDNNGNLIKRTGERNEGIIYNDFVLFPKKKLLAGTGQVGGDNTLYAYDLTKSSWMNVEHKKGGLYAEITDNLNTLYKQAFEFKMPSYQKKKDKPFVVLGLRDDKFDSKLDKLKGGNLVKVTNSLTVSENTSRDDLVAKIGNDALKKDRRQKYDKTPEEIIEWAKERERNNEPFQMWVGHGTDPFYIRINTLEKIIEAAPTTCYGFIYAEMGNTADPRIKIVLEEYIPRLAAAIHKYNAPTKIYFRYKNMFWATDVHEPLWRSVFFSGKYNDILVPSAEDTNNRLQDLNFTGRVGMFMSGYVDNYSMRLVDDNPTSWRPLSPGGQRSVSPYLRNAAIMLAYGCSHGVLFPIAYLEKPGYNILFALIKSGIIPILDREDILSIGSWHLIKDVDQNYLRRVNGTGHDLTKYNKNDDDAVFSKAGLQWCGSDITDWDYSKIASGCNYRWLNFIPPMPYGMIPITTSEYMPELNKKKALYVTSDSHKGYINSKKVDAKDFGSEMNRIAKQGSDNLLMKIDGASWGLFKIDSRHARLLLVDPGYVSPAKRDVTITLQNKMPKIAVDILTKENIEIKGNEIRVVVPAGSMRFIDFEYSNL